MKSEEQLATADLNLTTAIPCNGLPSDPVETAEALVAAALVDEPRLDSGPEEPRPLSAPVVTSEEAIQDADKRAMAERNLKWMLKFRLIMPLSLSIATFFVLRVPFSPSASIKRVAAGAATTSPTLPPTATGDSKPNVNGDSSMEATAPVMVASAAAASSPPENETESPTDQSGHSSPTQANSDIASPTAAIQNGGSPLPPVTDGIVTIPTSPTTLTDTPTSVPSPSPAALAQSTQIGSSATDIPSPNSAEPSSSSASEHNGGTPPASDFTSAPLNGPTPDPSTSASVANSTSEPVPTVSDANQVTPGANLASSPPGDVVERAAPPSLPSLSDIESLLTANFAWEKGEAGREEPGSLQPASVPFASPPPSTKDAAEVTPDQEPQFAGGQEVPPIAPLATEAPLADESPAAVETPVGIEQHKVAATRPATPTGPSLVLVNPATTGGLVRFLVGTRSIELHPGDRLEIPGGPKWQVTFHRGGALRDYRRHLPPGTYVFTVSRDTGWDLSSQPSSFAEREGLVEEAD